MAVGMSRKSNETVKALTIFFILVSFTFAGERVIPLDGKWQFKTDPQDVGVAQKWYQADSTKGWQSVEVPHTWQVEPGLEDYYGIAWYSRSITLPKHFASKKLRIEFNAVYRDATVWINGRQLGQHQNSGWTPFHFTIEDLGTSKLFIAVRVDNRFSKLALPYDRSFDWAADGGIIRSVRLKTQPATAIEALHVSPKLSDDMQNASVAVTVKTTKADKDYVLKATIFSPSHDCLAEITKTLKASSDSVEFTQAMTAPELWHFDRPNLYTMQVDLYQNHKLVHTKKTRFGIRSVEVRDGYYWLNGEAMRLMGVEWMPGSDPRYGMAESSEHIRSVLRDMKELNCVITRFHWQQGEAVFDFCDENGLLVQEEIPTWGAATKLDEIGDVEIMQLDETILAHFNHPSIYAWGLCNEINSRDRVGHVFIKNSMDAARKLDPTRLLVYASNSLHRNLTKEASPLMDFIEWNEYYGTWYKGGLLELRASLQSIQKAFPNKSLVISEYGLCECSPEFPVDDKHRIEILKNHTNAYRSSKNIAGSIFFDYNDYRTHIGDKCTGAFRQRVHGVVDLLGKRKPSWEALRREMSPIKAIELGEHAESDSETSLKVTVKTRSLKDDMPAFTLYSYELIWTAYNTDDQPIQSGRITLPDLAPGSNHSLKLRWPTFENFKKLQVEIYRPTGYSVISQDWVK